MFSHCAPLRWSQTSDWRSRTLCASSWSIARDAPLLCSCPTERSASDEGSSTATSAPVQARNRCGAPNSRSALASARCFGQSDPVLGSRGARRQRHERRTLWGAVSLSWFDVVAAAGLCSRRRRGEAREAASGFRAWVGRTQSRADRSTGVALVGGVAPRGGFTNRPSALPEFRSALRGHCRNAGMRSGDVAGARRFRQCAHVRLARPLRTQGVRHGCH